MWSAVALFRRSMIIGLPTCTCQKLSSSRLYSDKVKDVTPDKKPSDVEVTEERATDYRIWNIRYEAEGRRYPDESKSVTFFKKDFDPQLVLQFSKDIDFSWRGFKNYWKRFDADHELFSQRFILKRHSMLGPDLAAAHFVIFRGGGVRFFGSNKWHRRDNDDKYVLPGKYVPNVFVEGLDLENVYILYEGMVNIDNLRKLRWLSLRNCSHVDDWYLDKLGQYQDTLEYLDISGCPNVTDRGVAILHRLRHLKTLNVENLPKFQHRDLVCLLLEEKLPNCIIIGGVLEFDYLEPTKPSLPEQTPSQNDSTELSTTRSVNI